MPTHPATPTTCTARRLWRAAALCALLALALCAAACAGAGGFTDSKYAWRVEGGALTNYGGLDSEDSAARNTLRLVLVGRQFDITPVDSHTVETGTAAAYRSAADAAFGDATGTLHQFGDEMTLEFDVPSSDVNIAGLHLTGVFLKSDAESAIADPGKSCDVAWTASFTDGGAARELTAQQTLIGVDFSLD